MVENLLCIDRCKTACSTTATNRHFYSTVSLTVDNITGQR